jgi:hypothetical protein
MQGRAETEQMVERIEAGTESGSEREEEMEVRSIVGAEVTCPEREVRIQKQVLRTPEHVIPHAIANAAEIVLNRRFFEVLRKQMRSVNEINVGLFCQTILGTFHVIKTVPQSEVHERPTLSLWPDLPISELLVHIPAHEWPFPQVGHCVTPFCNGHIDTTMEAHITERHPAFRESNKLCSEVQTHVAGLLGVIYEYRGGKRWHCPMRTCEFEARRYEDIENHVRNDHA